MPKNQTRYVCQSCGSVFGKWMGQCSECGEWSSLQEETIAPSEPLGSKAKTAARHAKRPELQEQSLMQITDDQWGGRIATGFDESDRVFGGGIVPGSVCLLGGDPGIGKSTILLQMTAFMAQGHEVLYVSGEESAAQIKLRAERLDLGDASLSLAASRDILSVIARLEQQRADVVIIDSIQTMFVDYLEGAAGTVSQLRAVTNELIKAAKSLNIAIIIVGHVTKEGTIAGPRVIEHMVDVVLYFEGERGHPYRILRGIKNRFGATDEIGVFDMTSKGLAQVLNPSSLFLADHRDGLSGTSVFAAIEGTRPILVEIQALVVPSHLASPRRAVVGADHNRLAMVLAVLEARAGLRYSGLDVYLNIAGGIKILEPAGDLAMAVALISALRDTQTIGQLVVFGEIGLNGELRHVPQWQQRLREAEKLGFRHLWMPKPHHYDKDKNDIDAIKGKIKPSMLRDVGDLKRVMT